MTLPATRHFPAMNDASATAAPERALRIEGRDAPGSTATGYGMAAGDTFHGTLGSGDSDWVRIQLQPGSYRVSLAGRGANGVEDPLLRVFDASGRAIAQDDDGGAGLNSALTLTVGAAGTYYLAAGSFANAYTGGYSLQVTSIAPLRNFTMAEIARQLTDGYWQGTGRERRAFDADAGDVLNVDLSDLTAAGRHLANTALSAWEAVTGLRFNRNPGPNATVHITFDDNDSGAYSTSLTSGQRIVSSHVNIGLDWLSSYGTQLNGYSYQTYIHEIGHALGLGHAGNYNSVATYGTDNHYLNDSWQATIMSYFDQDQNTAVNASYASIMSPMVADILAIQNLYGPSAIRTGNNSYGETSNAGAAYSAIAGLLRNPNARDDVAFTIFDQGGIDLLDLSRDNSNQRIFLAPGTYSDAYGLVGNIGIALGTVIENVQAGSGNDIVNGNGVNNVLRGGAGNDILRGHRGNDVLVGGPGRDRLEGGDGNDTYYVDALDVVAEAAGAGVDTVRSYVSRRLGANEEHLDLIGAGVLNGTGNALANHMIGNAQTNDINGLGGNDLLRGMGGNDRLFGALGHDRLIGAAGNDLLIGAMGNDSMHGGAGADHFAFHGGRDIVLDFQDNIDTLRIDDALWGGGARSAGQALSYARIVDGDAVFDFGNGHVLTVNGVTALAALQDDLIIV